MHPGLLGLLHPGFFVSDDGSWMIVRFSAFYEALRSGQFPVRFLPRLNNNFGYPVADFLYPLFMYIGVPIKIVGVSFINTIKIIFALSFITSGLFCYYWLKKIFSSTASFVGALCYMYFPYHLWDMYQRGSVGEMLALAIVPFILWQMERRSIVFASIGIGLLITAHNTLALLFFPILFIYAWLRQVFNLKILFSVFLLGLGLAAFFWIPALYDKQFTVFDKTVVSDISSYFITNKNISLLGTIFFFTLIYSAVAIWLKKEKTAIFFFLLTVIITLFVFPFSKILWDILPGKNIIQFPFRLLSISVLGIAYLAAVNVDFTGKRFRISFTTLYLVLIFVSAWSFLQPKNFQLYPDGYYITNTDTTTVKNEYMPIWVKNQESGIKNQGIIFINGKGVVQNSSGRGTKQQFAVQTNTPSVVQLPIIYFPGWNVKVDNQTTKIFYNNPNGLIQINVNPGQHIIQSYFTETPIRVIADIISVCAVIIIVVIGIKKRSSY